MDVFFPKKEKTVNRFYEALKEQISLIIGIKYKKISPEI